jgi:ferredoxin
VKLRIEDSCCVGHGRCYALAPDVFDADDQGHAVLRVDGGVVPPELEDVARQAVANCPEDAIQLDD